MPFATNWTYPNLLPDGLTLDWWRVVFEDPKLFLSMQNWFLLAPVTVVVSAVVCLPAAYAFSRFSTIRVGACSSSASSATNAFNMGLLVAMATVYRAESDGDTDVGIVIVHVIGTGRIHDLDPGCGIQRRTSFARGEEAPATRERVASECSSR